MKTQTTTRTSDDEFSIAPKKLNILRHAIGYDDHGNDRYPNARSPDERRNRFVTSATDEDGKACLEMCAQGLMKDHGAQSGMGGAHYFTVTSDGKEVVLLHKPIQKKLSRGARRYQDFRTADSGMSFKDWLKSRSYKITQRYGY